MPCNFLYKASKRRRRWLLQRWRMLLLIPRLLCIPESKSGVLPLVKQFTEKEIRSATREFNTIIGSDSYGTIYKALFSDGTFAAVRKARVLQQDDRIFIREVQLLGRTNHRHLVKLRGFSEGHERFLVFDYMEHGSLKNCLHDPLKTPLPWRTRLQIAISVAAAVEYLLFFCHPPLCSIFIDSSNVFLDENFVAKLCYVNLLRSDRNPTMESDTVSSKVSGITCHHKRVIFQYGVLILELITGQSFQSEGADLIHWVQNSSFNYSIHKMVDSDLGNSYDSKELTYLLNIARLCTKNEDVATVSIRWILRYLQRKIEPFRSQS